jgi:putative ABC transport system permease protein
MNTFTLGVRNAFRNTIRSVSLTVILGLSIGLCLVMLIAHQAVGKKITDIKQSVGNTITISPAGFSNFSQANNALTSTQLNKVATLPHITSLTQSLNDHVTTIGSTTPGFGSSKNGASADETNNTTSLTSPVTLDTTGNGDGPRIFIRDGGTLPANFSLPISVLGTTTPLRLNGSNLTLSSGSTIDGSKDVNNALISTDMASKNNLKVGSTFTAYGATLTVTGIFTSSTKMGGNTVIVSLPTLQRLSGQADVVTDAVATVDSLDNLSGVTTAVKNTLGSSADIQSSQDEANSTVQPLQNVASISLFSLIGAVIAGSVIILLTMVMIVRERRREIGILKAIGASNGRVIFQFMSEAVTLTLAGAIIGVLIGIAGGNPVTNLLVTNSTQSNSAAPVDMKGGPITNFGANGSRTATFGAKPTGGFVSRNGTSLKNSVRNITTNIGWSILAYGLAAALTIAVIGSACAGWMIAHVKPYEVMRAE